MLDWVGSILAYQFPKLGRKEIRAMLLFEELKNTRVYQEGVEDGILQNKREIVPLLHELGLSVAQISDRLSMDLQMVEEILRSPS